MSERDKKRMAAMRLFGALSGVDEEYLAKCEADAAGAAKGNIVFFERFGHFVRKYGMAVAAVFCVAVLGASVAGYRLGGGKTADSNMQNSGMAPARNNTAEIAVEEKIDETQIYADESTTATGLQDGVQNLQAEIPQSDSLQQEKALETEYMDMEDRKLEEARAVSVVGEYLPDVFPESGEMDYLDTVDTEGQEKIVLGWNTGSRDAAENWFYLSIENLGDSRPDQTGTYTFFEEGEFTEGDVEEYIASNTAYSADVQRDGKTLSVLYEEQGNYVMLTIWGEPSGKEVWEMLNSVEGD